MQNKGKKQRNKICKLRRLKVRSRKDGQKGGRRDIEESEVV
jgi:hypothetical protein